MVAAYTTPDLSNKDLLTELISKYYIGGVIFMKGTPVAQATYTNYFQSISKTPLMMAIDGEWGLAMRLDSTISFPRQMMLGAITNNKLIYDMGVEIGRECSRIGLQINFAPVVDINNNANNPVINSRSFGELKLNVAVKGEYYMTGMQDKHILTTAKHFPGHGDTDADSHKSMPVIPFSKTRLDSLELYPFQYLINRNLTGIMVAHLYVPELDRTKNQPSTLSPKIVRDLLINEMGFKGLIFTDALNMKGVSQFYKPGELEVKAILAGNDVLLFPEDVPTAVLAIKAAIKSGKLNQQMIDDRCKKILYAKKWMGIDTLKPVKIENLYADLNTDEANLLNIKLIRGAITVAKDTPKQLPFKNLDKTTIAYVTFSNSGVDTFYLAARNYTAIRKFVVPSTGDYSIILAKTIDSLKNYNTVIINVIGASMYPNKQYGITTSMVDITNKIAQKCNTIMVLHANPYALNFFKDAMPNIETVVMAYDYSKAVQFETPQVMFGALPAEGLLPVGAGGLKAGTGIQYKAINRLRYGKPFEAGMNQIKLEQIDSVVNVAIKDKATPGCQVLVAKNGIVIYNKSFGTYTYDSKQPVTNNSIYDLASITKAAATTISLMKLYDEKLFSLDSTLGYYLPELKNTNKDTLLIKNILTHQAQLFPWVPFYLSMIQDYFNSNVDLKHKKKSAAYSCKVNENVYLRNDFKFLDSTISPVKTELYSVQVAENVFINPACRDKIFQTIYNTKLNEKKEVVYSDLGFYMLPEVIKNLSGKRIDEYTRENFYLKLGAQTLCYNPLYYFPKDQIVPTEKDEVFRKQLIQGYVHDPGAAMLGGVSGHAGLFSNSNDLAKLLQMLLFKGNYGGEQFIQASTVDLFTSCPFCEQGNRKGYGFDKAERDTTKLDPTCRCTSELSFGHTGFTGNIFWVDPAQDLVYIFLSNRVCPDADNTILANTRVRPVIQQAIYNAIEPLKM
jgi:beta-glucosidase-like glycosyl hydrolase/CubicO group peptidase (beta-lactamase class C family)